MVVWMIRTDWIYKGVCGGDITLYANEDKARAAYSKAIEEELENYGDSIDGYIIEKDDDWFRIYQEYSYCYNHFEITLESQTIIE